MKGELLALAAMLMFATNIIITRLGSRRLATNAGYLIVVAVNIVFAGAAFVVQQLMRADPLQWQWRGVALFALAGLFATWLGRWFMMESVVRLGPAKASAFQVSSPLFTFAFALAFLSEHLDRMAIFAMALTAGGLLLLSLAGIGDRSRPIAPDKTPRAPARARLKTLVTSSAAIGLGSSAAYAVGNVLRGAAIRGWNEPILGALIGAVTGIALQLAFGADQLAVVRNLRNANRNGMLLFALSGVLTICAQTMVIVAMAHAPVAIVSLITLCTPLVVFPASYFLLGNDEGINAQTITGAFLTLAGIAMIVLR
jgi:drug/metabolite transporter (DMT)-like permease